MDISQQQQQQYISNQLQEEINTIKSYFERPHQQFVEPHDENVIMVLGITGTGKTSFSAYLSGYDLIVDENGFGDKFIRYNDQIQKTEKRTIGQHGLISETSTPNKFETQIKLTKPPVNTFQEITYSHQQYDHIYDQQQQYQQLQQQEIQKWTIFDCPGFSDSKGHVQDIINSVQMAKIFKYAKQIKFVLLLDGYDLEGQNFGTSRGANIKSVIETMVNMQYGTDIDFEKNLIIVFTKTCKNNINQLEKKMKGFFASYQQTKEMQQYSKYFNSSKVFQQLERAKKILFPGPNDSTQINQIFMKEQQQQFIQQVFSIKSFCMTQRPIAPFQLSALDKLVQIWEFQRQFMRESFKNLCKLISEGLQNFNLCQLNEIQQNIKNYENDTNKNAIQLKSKTLPSDEYSEINTKFLSNLQKFVKQYINIAAASQMSKHEFRNQQNDIKQLVDEIEKLINVFYNEIFLNFSFFGSEINTFFGQIGQFELLEGITCITLSVQAQTSKLGECKNNNSKNSTDDKILCEIKSHVDKIGENDKTKVHNEKKRQQEEGQKKGNQQTNPENNCTRNVVCSGIVGAVIGYGIAATASMAFAPLMIAGGAIFGLAGYLFS